MEKNNELPQKDLWEEVDDAPVSETPTLCRIGDPECEACQ